MQQDNSIGGTGINYLTAAVVIQQLQAKGYSVGSNRQPWRHFVADLSKDGKPYFLKLASTADIGQRTSNEPTWNNNIKRLLTSDPVDCFDVAEIMETGYVGQNYYYVAEYIAGNPLAKSRNGQNQPELGRLEEFLPRISQLNHWIYCQTGTFGLFLDGEYASGKLILSQNIHSYYIEQALSRYRAALSLGLTMDLNQNLRVINQFDHRHLKLALNHGDFAPWHLLLDQSSDKLWLIDAEHASNHIPKYYDVAFFYHRLYTAMESPRLADRYLELFIDKLQTQDLKHFQRQFQYLLASRIIDGFLSHYQGDGTRLEYHGMIQERFVENCLDVQLQSIDTYMYTRQQANL